MKWKKKLQVTTRASAIQDSISGRKGEVPEHRIMSEAIHELWSREVCMGELSARRMGSVGEVQPTVVPAAAVISVAGKVPIHGLLTAIGNRISKHFGTRKRFLEQVT